MDRKLLSINPEQAYKDFPKSMDYLISKWFPFKADISDMDDNYKKALGSLILDKSPRTLYDFFDDMEIYINILKIDNGFSYSVFPKENSNWTKDRIDAEHEAILEAFKILEEKL